MALYRKQNLVQVSVPKSLQSCVPSHSCDCTRFVPPIGAVLFHHFSPPHRCEMKREAKHWAAAPPWLLYFYDVIGVELFWDLPPLLM